VCFVCRHLCCEMCVVSEMMHVCNGARVCLLLCICVYLCVPVLISILHEYITQPWMHAELIKYWVSLLTYVSHHMCSSRYSSDCPIFWE
jgi:hypothetical protein